MDWPKKSHPEGWLVPKARRITSSLRRVQRVRQVQQRLCSRRQVQRGHQPEQQQAQGPEPEREFLFCHKQPRQRPKRRPGSETFACRFLCFTEFKKSAIHGPNQILQG